MACEERPKSAIEYSRHQPTDSMVTVRLSEPVSASEPRVDLETTPVLDLPNDSAIWKRRSSVQIMTGIDLDSPSTDVSTSDVVVSPDVSDGEATDVQDPNRLSPDRLSDDQAAVFRSRSSSVCSIRSEDSNPVDWVELDKSEEQESQDQGSDEV
jgi:hypothetical protein